MGDRRGLQQHVSEEGSGVIDRPAVARRGRSWRRRGALAVLAGLAMAWTGACQGPVATTTIDVRAACIGYALGEPVLDLGERTIRIEMGAPEWADQGETVSLSDMRVTTYDLFDELAQGNPALPWVSVSMSGEGLSGAPNLSSREFYDPGTTTTDLRLVEATVDGAAGSVGTARVTEIFLGEAHANIRCTPVADSPTRLAAIEIR